MAEPTITAGEFHLLALITRDCASSFARLRQQLQPKSDTEALLLTLHLFRLRNNGFISMYGIAPDSPIAATRCGRALVNGYVSDKGGHA